MRSRSPDFYTNRKVRPRIRGKAKHKTKPKKKVQAGKKNHLPAQGKALIMQWQQGIEEELTLWKEELERALGKIPHQKEHYAAVIEGVAKTIVELKEIAERKLEEL